LKKILIFPVIFFLFACADKRDGFAKIKTGMKSAQVVKLVGAPARKQEIGVSTWWIYSDPEKHMVVINSDTVANCVTQKDAIRIMDDALRTYDSMHRKKNL